METLLEKIAKTAEPDARAGRIFAFELGRIDFTLCHELQDALQNLRIAGEISDVILFAEHNPVYTITKHTDASHLLYSEAELAQRGIVLAPVDRGGDITFHGPGQIMGYPIINLKTNKLNVRKYIDLLEDVIIGALEQLGIKGGKNRDARGVWISNRKIAALGVRITRYVTKHGFALNNDVELDFFKGIIPCGIADKAVTSIKQEIGKVVERRKLVEMLISQFQNTLNREVEPLIDCSTRSHD